MAIISLVLENSQTKVALYDTIYDKEYNLLSIKEATCVDPAKLCLELLGGEISTADVKYIGVAIDSSVSNYDTIIDDIEKSTGTKCIVTSLINARALGEAYTSDDTSSLIFLKIDDTVECGVVIDKKVFTGANQSGLNIPHMVIDFDGYNCTCGNKGCFEACVSNNGLRNVSKDAGIPDWENITHKKLFAINTPEAEQAKAKYIEYLASAVTDIINLFQPNELVLEGPFTEIADLLTPMTDIVLRKQYTRDNPNKCNIRLACKHNDIDLLGAALLAR